MMSEIEFQIPPYTVDDVVSSLSQGDQEHVGWQIRAWQANKIHSEFGITGKGVTVGVGDTGVSRSHLRGDLKGVVKQETFVGDHNPYDRNSHGSHCLGIVGARSDSSGMIGYAPDCEMLSAKVLSDRGSGGDNGISNGIRWMVDNGAMVISLSLGSPSASSRINSAIKYAMDMGVLVVAAAGNDGRSNSVDNPAATSGCIPVGAVDNNLRLAGFSDRGPQMTSRGVVGAGVKLYSCGATGYVSMSGTSMATPSVAGCLALLIEAEIKYLGKRVTKSTEAFINLVNRFHVDLGPNGDDPAYGNGAFDIYSCIKAMAESDQPEDPVDEPKPKPPVESKPVASWSHGGYRFTTFAEKL